MAQLFTSRNSFNPRDKTPESNPCYGEKTTEIIYSAGAASNRKTLGI
jgi:hypothetical protein